mgnify:CR=1 FL=1
MVGEARLRGQSPAQEAHTRPSAKKKGGRGRVPPGRGPPALKKKRRP